MVLRSILDVVVSDGERYKLLGLRPVDAGLPCIIGGPSVHRALFVTA